MIQDAKFVSETGCATRVAEAWKLLQEFRRRKAGWLTSGQHVRSVV